MTTSTFVGERRRRAPRALLFATTILAACVAVPATAQQAAAASSAQESGTEAPAQASAGSDASRPKAQAASGGATANGVDPGSGDGDGDGSGDTGSSSSSGDVVPPKIMTITPGGVTLAEGGFTYKQVDLSVGTLELERFFDGVPYDPDGPAGNGGDPENMPFGTHTSNNFEIFVSPTWVKANTQSGTVTYPQHWHTVVHMGSGASGTYWQSSLTDNETPLADDGEAEKGVLVFSNGTYTYTDQSGTVYQFNPNVHITGNPVNVDLTHTQRVASISYPDGRVRSFSYDANGRLKLVSDSSGYAIVFDRNANGLISAACGFNTSRTYVNAATTCASAPLKASYGYDSSGLVSVTDVLQQVTHYTNGYADASGSFVTCIQPPGYSGCKIANSYSQHTIDQTMGDGSTWHVVANNAFSRNLDDYVYGDGQGETQVTDPATKMSDYTFTGSTPYGVTDANGHFTQYVFAGGSDVYEATNGNLHMGSLLQEVDLPEGNKYLANNGGPYHALLSQTMRAKPNSGLADQTVSYGYSCTNGTLTPACTKPTSKTDANGNETDWLYTSFGMPYWEMQPAPTSGAARPLKLYTYAQKYAWVLDGNGNLVTSGNPVWLPASETECQTVAGSSNASCDANAPQMVTTYEYGADGTVDDLLLRGKVVSADGQSLRTCYQYDWQGNRITETSPRAGLASCPA